MKTYNALELAGALFINSLARYPTWPDEYRRVIVRAKNELKVRPELQEAQFAVYEKAADNNNVMGIDFYCEE